MLKFMSLRKKGVISLPTRSSSGHNIIPPKSNLSGNSIISSNSKAHLLDNIFIAILKSLNDPLVILLGKSKLSTD